MNFTCSHNSNYFDSPDFLSLAAHVTTIVTVPIHCIGLYCIVCRTPAQMRGIKFNILQLHCLTIVFDTFITFLEIPFLLLPYFVFYPLGIVRFLGSPNEYHFALLVIVTGCMGIAMICILENRFFMFCDLYSLKLTSLWSKLRDPWLITHYLLGIVGLTPFLLFVPDQQKSLQRIFKSLPCLPDYIYTAPFFVLAEDYTFHILSWVVYLVLVNSEGAFFLTFLVMSSWKQLKSRTMSEKTYKMQKTFLQALMIWFSVEVLFIGVPIIYAIVAVTIDYYNQTLTNLGVIMGFTHGIASTMTMISGHRPYREAVFEMFLTRKQLDALEKSSRSQRTINVVPRTSSVL